MLPSILIGIISKFRATAIAINPVLLPRPLACCVNATKNVSSNPTAPSPRISLSSFMLPRILTGIVNSASAAAACKIPSLFSGPSFLNATPKATMPTASMPSTANPFCSLLSPVFPITIIAATSMPIAVAIFSMLLPRLSLCTMVVVLKLFRILSKLPRNFPSPF